MRFLVESGTYRIDNVGDIAMLERTVRRLVERVPGASIGVVTERPERLAQVLPGVEPVPAAPWFRLPAVPVPAVLEESGIGRRVRWRERLLAGRAPRLARLLKRTNPRSPAAERADADRFYRAVREADAVVASGGGYVSDFFYAHAWRVFATLDLAQGFGKPTGMFGVGLGPIGRPELIQHGGPVLRRLDVLGLREPLRSPAEARRLGVDEARVVVTGDDAIAPAAAYPIPPVEERAAIGVNLRLAATAEVPVAALPMVRSGVAEAAGRLGAGLVPLVVRTALSPDNDVDAAARVFGLGDGDLQRARAIRTPAEALAEVARCRVVVTGAYHNAVFAMAMGVPVVGLCRSAYYEAKLGGAAAGFGAGMTVLSLEDRDLQAKLAAEVVRYWDEAPALAPRLVAAAAEQVARGDAAYERFLGRLDPDIEGSTNGR